MSALWKEMDVVMNFRKKDGSMTEIHVNLSSDPAEVARAYCKENDIKLSLVPSLAEVIRKRRDEALRAYRITEGGRSQSPSPSQSPHSSPTPSSPPSMSQPNLQPSNPFDEYANFDSFYHSSVQSNPFDKFDSFSANEVSSTINPFDVFSKTPSSKTLTADVDRGNFGHGDNNIESTSLTPFSSSLEGGAKSPSLLAFFGAQASNDEVTRGRSDTKHHQSFLNDGTDKSKNVLTVRSSSAQSRLSSPRLQITTTPESNGARHFSNDDADSKTHFYLLGGHNLTPKQSEYMPKMLPARARSISPQRPLKNQASVDRLYNEHEKMQDRYRRLSMSVDKMKRLEIESADFRKGLQSPITSANNRSDRRIGGSFHEWLHYSGLKWAEVRDRQTKERARELAQKEEDEFKANSTFMPQLATTTFSAPERPVSSKSVFDSLYNSRVYYADRAKELRKTLGEHASKELIFSPKLETGRRTEALAKKWREKEDNTQMKSLHQIESRKPANTNISHSPVPLLSTTENYEKELTLADLANTNTGLLVSTNPFDSVIEDTTTSTMNEVQTKVATKEPDCTMGDDSYAHLEFFDSIVDDEYSKNIILDNNAFDIFTIQELGQMQSPRAVSSNLFNRLHNHKVAVAVELAKRKHEKVFKFQPEICGKSLESSGYVSIKDDPDKFFARLSQTIMPKSRAGGEVVRPTKRLDSRAEKELVTRMTVRYPKQSEQLRSAAINSQKKSIEDAPRYVYTKYRSNMIAARARRQSLSLIFDLLLATVEYSRFQDECNNHESKTAWTHALADSAKEQSKTGKSLLDTRKVITSMLHPKALVHAIDLIIQEVYPEPLSFEKFVDGIEKLISSGKCEPISSHLSAPDRLSWSEEEVNSSKPVLNNEPTLNLQARRVTEKMARKRNRASQIDLVQYAAQRERRMSELRLRFGEDQLKECTFAPALPASETYLAAKAAAKNKIQGAVVGKGIVDMTKSEICGTHSTPPHVPSPNLNDQSGHLQTVHSSIEKETSLGSGELTLSGGEGIQGKEESTGLQVFDPPKMFSPGKKERAGSLSSAIESFLAAAQVQSPPGGCVQNIQISLKPESTTTPVPNALNSKAEDSITNSFSAKPEATSPGARSIRGGGKKKSSSEQIDIL